MLVRPAVFNALLAAAAFFASVVLSVTGRCHAQQVTLPGHLRHGPVDSTLVDTGWIALFDGRTLTGWRAGLGCSWQVSQDESSPERLVASARDGQGKYSSKAEGSGHDRKKMSGLLRTASQFDDFELSLDFGVVANERNQDGVGRNGVGRGWLLLRTSPDPGRYDGIKISLSGDSMNSSDGGDCGQIEFGSDSWKVGRAKLKQNGQPNRMRIRLVGQSIEIYVNDSLVSRSRNIGSDGFLVKRGYIGFLAERPGLFIEKILLKPVFSRRDEAVWINWNASHENGFQAKIQRDAGAPSIHLSGGPGYVESGRQFANFVMQTKCRVSAGGNSGIFFRCIPGENTNGYESQIDNGIVDGDPVQPANCGTGGIFRRVDARQVNAMDESWFAQTIVVEGPHVAVWVNGLQVTDWTDRRKPNTNPRRGLRTDAGTIMLQGHDEDTTTEFRNFRIRELKSRR